MIRSIERMSPSHRRRANPGWRLFLRVVLIAFFGWALVAHFFFSTWRVDSVSMSPALRPADRIVVSPIPFGPRVPLTQVRLPGFRAPARGDLVVVEPPYVSPLSGWRRLAEPVVAFFTFQRATLSHSFDGATVDRFMVKRIVGIPGDTIRMQAFQALIRPLGTADFLPEDKVLTERFTRRIEAPAAGGDPSPAFTGTADQVTLGVGEYYVLGDNRTSSSDSRSWGPVAISRIQAAVLFRYWPLSAIGGL